MFPASVCLDKIFESRKKQATLSVACFWRRHPDLNWGMKLLQSFALPLGYSAINFGAGTRSYLLTNRIALAKLMHTAKISHPHNYRFGAGSRSCLLTNRIALTKLMHTAKISLPQNYHFGAGSRSCLLTNRIALAKLMHTAKISHPHNYRFGAGDEIRTRDICLGKATLYH